MAIIPGVPAPHLAPLMGVEAIGERGGVRYHGLEARSLLNRCDSPRMPFEWTVNPYRGCAMGCRYCYAAYTHEFLGIKAPEDFHQVVYVKRGAEGETARKLQRVVRRGEQIALGTVTDPYQPGEAEYRVTRRFLEAVVKSRSVRLGITTKGALILRDVEILKRIHERSHLTVHVSLISTRRDLLRKLEPWAPPPDVRLEVMRQLVLAGLDVSLSLAPVLPALTDREEEMDELFARVASAGVRRVFCNILFLRSPTKEKYLAWVGREFPQYAEAYARAYANRVYLGGSYRDRIQKIVQRLREKHGMDAPAPSRVVALEQLSFRVSPSGEAQAPWRSKVSRHKVLQK
jgi:DNA repair photolyase